MQLVNSKQYGHHPLEGLRMEFLYGTVRPDGDGRAGEVNWKAAAKGTRYFAQLTDNQSEEYVKVKNDGADNDWVLVNGVISQSLVYADFTDSTSTTGTKELNGTIPVGAYLEKAQVQDVTGFTGDTTATIQISGGVDVTTDVDGYTTGTPSVFTTAAAVVVGVPSGVRTVTTEGEPVVTITKGSDWGTGTAGALTVTLFYKN